MAYVAAAVTVMMSMKSASDQKQAGKRAEGIERMNAAKALAESQEAARRLKLDQDKVTAETKARAAASGVTGGGTVETYLSEMQKNFKSELDWVNKSGASAANINLRRGEYQRQIANANAWGTMASGISSGLSGL